MALDPDALAAVTSRHLATDVRVEGLERLSGGASRETWSFSAVGADGSSALVLRRDPAGATGASERATEFELLAAVARCGVPVPRVRFMLDRSDELGSGFVMDHVDGETIPRRILRDARYELARSRLTAQAARAAAAVHACPVDSLPHLPVASALDQVDQWRQIMDGFGEPRPAFEIGLRWLVDRAPEPPASPRLVHGDFRIGNFLVGDEGLRALLDWELSHLGDPLEDLGWLCVRSWRFGNVDRVVGGFGDVDELLDTYAAATGDRPAEETLRWWCALGTLKWGLMCRVQAEAHLSGLVRSVELATLGRRVAEMEWDLLLLVEGGW
jgi:aminoglycoside phosphotransferase (APT) family kinase protein